MKLLLLYLILFVSINSFAQDIGQKRSDSILLKKSNKKTEFSKGENFTLEKINQKINFTNYCLNKYRKEKLMGYCAFVIGSGVAGFMQIDDLNGTTNTTNIFNAEYAAAGESLNEKIIATRKYEGKMEDIKKQKEAFLIVGGVIAFAGIVLQIDSYKWLKYAYVGENGIGIKIKLNK